MAEEHGKALVEFRPETGRTHQLRAHALYGIGIPLMGDPVYGTGEQTLLHASAIRLQRDGKDPVEAHAPLPKIFLSHGFSDPQPALQTAADAPKAAPADEADARS